MQEKNSLFNVLGLDRANKSTLKKAMVGLDISMQSLLYYNDNSILPPSNELDLICSRFSVSKYEIMIRMGIYDQELKELLASSSKNIIRNLEPKKVENQLNHRSVFKTDLGELFEGDCISLMSSMDNDSVDLIFADPPFNLSKLYPSNMDDNVSTNDYIKWSEQWLNQCIRILRPGGSLFLWNLPKWNTYFSEFLNHRLTFRHWIAADIKYSLPISSRLYPSHYSLLYYIKGEKPLVFKPDRMKMDICSSCYKELRDYGGYKDKMNPKGINMSDVWYDIPPVRHSKYKTRKEANELSIKLLDRVIEMASNKGGIVFDPFGGAGTTYAVSELKERRWIGIELGPTDGIIDRLQNKGYEREHLAAYRAHYNQLFSEKVKKEREKRGLWTPETLKNNKLNSK